jgi:predicted DsbA family dithiol-disulfide isomerase
MARADRMAREFVVEVEWVPFELHSEVSPEGKEKDKADQSRSDVHDRLHALAEAEGLPMQSNPVRSNGHKALAAAEWAQDQGREVFDRVHRALFQAYFADSANISTIEQVEQAPAQTGIDREARRASLERDQYRERVDEYTQLARQNGINGTPTFILDDKFVISGAQDWSVFESMLTRLEVPRRRGVEAGPDAPNKVVANTLIAPDEIWPERGASIEEAPCPATED